MSETAKTKRLKTMLFVWITTGVNQYLVIKDGDWYLWIIGTYMNKRKKNNEKEELVAIPPLYTCIFVKSIFK